jgi:peptidoglycan hydrolase-like protein with peptidoglycan-binding domain
MPASRILIAAVIIFCWLAPVRSSAKTRRKPSGSAKKSAASRSRKAKSRQSWRNRQLNPSPERYRDIQQALAAKGYYTGEPNGVWDDTSVVALRHFQRDQNLEPSGKLDSQSIIALGLGPKYEIPANPPSGTETQPGP